MTPPTIQIDFPPTCTAPTPCGGSPTGTFFYTGACIGQDEFQSVTNQIEGVCGAGSVQITSYDGGMAGHAIFVGGANLCRRVTGSVTVGARITGTCANATVCGLLSSTGLSQGGFTGSCAVVSGGCECLVTREINIDNAGVAYSVGADSLTITSSGQTFATCLSGQTFTTQELDAGTATHEPGVATLTQQ